MAAVVGASFLSGLSSYTVLQGVGTAASAISSIAKGRAEARQARDAAEEAALQADEYRRAAAQLESREDVRSYAKWTAAAVTRSEGEIAARDAELQAEQDYIDGQAAANEAMRRYLTTVGQQRVGFAASGVDVTSGTAARVQEETERRGAESVETEERNARIRRLGSESRAGAHRRQAAYTAAAYEDEARSIAADASDRAAQMRRTADRYDLKAGGYRRNVRYHQLSGYLAAAGTVAGYAADVANRK